MLLSEDGAQPAPSRPHPHHRHSPRPRSIRASHACSPHKDVPHNVYTILILIQVGPEDEQVLADDKVRWKGEAVVAVLADSERAANEAAAKVKIDYEVLPAVFDIEEALKPGAPLVNEYHGQNYYMYDSGASPEGALRRRREGLRRGRPHPRADLLVLADRAGADGDDRLHRRARGQRPLHLLHQHAGDVLHARQHLDHPADAGPQAAYGRRHGRRRFRRQGRRHRRADRHPRRQADRPAGLLHLQPRGGDADFLAARRREDRASRTAS